MQSQLSLSHLKVRDAIQSTLSFTVFRHRAKESIGRQEKLKEEQRNRMKVQSSHVSRVN